jgi:hypothetical protein
VQVTCSVYNCSGVQTDLKMTTSCYGLLWCNRQGAPQTRIQIVNRKQIVWIFFKNKRALREPAMRERKLDFSTTKKTEDFRYLTFQVSVIIVLRKIRLVCLCVTHLVASNGIVRLKSRTHDRKHAYYWLPGKIDGNSDISNSLIIHE